jgi:hypothetical protein
MTDVEDRARKSKGTNSDAVYRMTARLIDRMGHRGGTLLDVGCGVGQLWPFVQDCYDRYAGTDVLRFDGFPEAGEVHMISCTPTLLAKSLEDVPSSMIDKIRHAEC